MKIEMKINITKEDGILRIGFPHPNGWQQGFVVQEIQKPLLCYWAEKVATLAENGAIEANLVIETNSETRA